MATARLQLHGVPAARDGAFIVLFYVRDGMKATFFIDNVAAP
jgi:hypothetical protein